MTMRLPVLIASFLILGVLSEVIRPWLAKRRVLREWSEGMWVRFRHRASLMVAGKSPSAAVTASSDRVIPSSSGHEGSVMNAAFSPGGTHVVTLSLDKTTWLWSADGSGMPWLSAAMSTTLANIQAPADSAPVAFYCGRP